MVLVFENYLMVRVDDGCGVVHAGMLVSPMRMMRGGWVSGVTLVMVPSGPLHARSHGHHNIELLNIWKKENMYIDIPCHLTKFSSV